MGVLEVLTLVFVVLKLTDFIDWSWWAVLSPMYVYVAVIFSVIIGAVLRVVTGEIARRR